MFTYHQVDYRLATCSVRPGSVRATLFRRGEVKIWDRRYRLDDEAIFTTIADKSLLAANHDCRMAARLSVLAKQIESACDSAGDWICDGSVWRQPTMFQKNSVVLNLTVCPREIRQPGLSDYELSLEVEPKGQIRVSHNCHLLGLFGDFVGTSSTPVTNRDFERYFQSLGETIRLHTEALMNPIESELFSTEARQALLVLVPLRLVELARSEDQVDWYLELASGCLEKLKDEPDLSRRLVLSLFFGLIVALLTRPGSAAKQWDLYEELGTKLARMRRSDENLPLNPVMGYRTWLQDPSELSRRISKSDRAKVNWVLEEARLEQIVDAMNLL